MWVGTPTNSAVGRRLAAEAGPLTAAHTAARVQALMWEPLSRTWRAQLGKHALSAEAAARQVRPGAQGLRLGTWLGPPGSKRHRWQLLAALLPDTHTESGWLAVLHACMRAGWKARSSVLC